MSRKVRRQAIGVALFPFLAVLICTMGALIVLLVLLVQQARLDAHEVAKNQQELRAQPDPLAAERKALREKVEDENWRKGILEGQRSERLEELANARLRVEHLEDHIRRLQDQARTLIARAREIDEGRETKSPDLTAEQNELARIQAEITKKKAELDQKKKELAAKDRSFALIPYDGPNGTKRRPIYIECTRRGVVLQPEGVVLGPDDFSGPLNPGNPLDAALRAVRETWKRSGEPGEPYPLLVVRPDGIVAYSAAREALRGWDDEFGYELIDDDKQLDFGGPNPALREQLIQIVGVARQRQVMLAAAMPRKFGADAELTSFAPEDQPAFQSAIAAARGAGGVSNGNGELSAGLGTGGSALASGGSGRPGSFAAGGAGGYPGASQFAGSGTNSTTSGQGTGNGSGGTGSGSTAPGNMSSGGTGNSSNGYAGGNYSLPNGSGPQGGSGQSSGNQANNGQYGSGTTGSNQYASAQSGANGSQAAGAAAGSQAAGAGQGSSSAGAPSGASGQATSGGSSSPSGDPNQQTSASLSMQRQQVAMARANNWGLPNAKGRTTAVTRPIRVVCLPDKLVVVPDRGVDRPASVIPTSAELQPAEVDAFVVAVQKHLEAWGPALQNGYWKPVLQVEVSRAAESHFNTLEALLRGSGFEIQRKAP